MDIEKTYWTLKGSGKLDLETFHQRFSSLLPEELLPGQLRVKFLLKGLSLAGEWGASDQSGLPLHSLLPLGSFEVAGLVCLYNH